MIGQAHFTFKLDRKYSFQPKYFQIHRDLEFLNRRSKKTYWDMREEITEFLPNAEIPCDENNGQNLELSSKMLITKALNCKLTWLNFKTG